MARTQHARIAAICAGALLGGGSCSLLFDGGGGAGEIPPLSPVEHIFGAESSDDEVTDVLVGDDGSLYLCGTFSAFFTVRDATVTPRGGSVDSFVIRVSPDRTTDWARVIGGTGEQACRALAFDRSVDPPVLVAVGEFGNESASVGEVDVEGQSRVVAGGVGGAVFEARLALEDGAFEPVAKVVENPGAALAVADAAVDARGNLYLVGTDNPGGGPNMQVLWRPADRGQLPVSVLVSNSSGNGTAVAVGDGAVFVAGYTTGPWQLPLDRPCSDEVGVGSERAIVVRLSPDLGACEAAHDFGGGGFHRPFDLTVAGDSVFVSGAGQSLQEGLGAGEFGIEKGPQGADRNAFAASYSLDLAPRWLRWISGDSAEQATGVAVADDRVLVTGTFFSSPLSAGVDGDGNEVQVEHPGPPGARAQLVVGLDPATGTPRAPLFPCPLAGSVSSLGQAIHAGGAIVVAGRDGNVGADRQALVRVIGDDLAACPDPEPPPAMP